MAVPTDITPEVVEDITGVAGITAATIAQARGIIELKAGVVLTNLAVFGARNRDWLGRAIAYQAAWMPGQPDLFERLDVTATSSEGGSTTLRDPNSLLIAPLAKMALRRVSWTRSRTVRVSQGRAGRLASLINSGEDEVLGAGQPWGVPGQAAYDPGGGWEPV